MIAESMIELARDATSEKRRAMLRQLTDLFLDGTTERNVSEMALFEEVVSRAMINLEQKDRAAYAEQLADKDQAPLRVVYRFAVDDIEVAAPVLKRSAALDDAALVQLANEQSDAHRQAIAERRSVAAIVTDVLVQRGSQLVRQALAGNLGARISRNGFGHLIRHASADEALRFQLAQRTDLPEDIGNLLSRQIADGLKRVVQVSREATDQKAMRLTADRVRGHLYSVMDQREREVRSVSDLVGEIKSGKASLDRELTYLARNDRAFDIATMVQHLTGSDHGTVMKTITGGPLDPLMILFRCMKVEWPAFEEVLRLRAHRNREPYVHSADIQTTYQSLTPEAANRVMRFLKIRRAASRVAPAEIL